MLAAARKGFPTVLAFLLLTSVAVAQNNRSAVSVTGNDAASCTVPDPCRTFAVALSKTNSNGEVVALTSGGYGPFTIDKPATIVAAPGIYAALVAATGTAIEAITGTPGGKVVIRGLHLYGMGSTSSAGISANGGFDEVHVENCVIDGFGRGIDAHLNVRVSDTTIRRCFETGVFISGVKGTINRVEVRDSDRGIMSIGTGANVTVRGSVAADCSIGFDAAQGELNIENSLATNNLIGIRASSGGTVRVSNTMATDNSTVGFQNLTGSTFVSWGNNRVRGNTTDKDGTITLVTQD